MGKLVLSSALSWFLGARFHSGRTAKKLKAKFQKEQKQLYSQYYNDVYKLSEQNQELQLYVEQLQDALRQTEAKHELEALQRDYDEFKQPDIDGDDRISRAEFNMYVKNYLSHYPGLSEKDYPKFEDFDHDNDGTCDFSFFLEQTSVELFQPAHDCLAYASIFPVFLTYFGICFDCALQGTCRSKNTHNRWPCKPSRPKRKLPTVAQRQTKPKR